MRIPWATGAIAVAALSVCAAQTCEPLSDGVKFCASLPYNVSSTLNGFAQDSLAKQKFDITLNGYSSCKGLVLTSSCMEAFRAYACAVSLPKCSSATAQYTMPCRSMCNAYCSACKLVTCPCADLPLDSDGDCFTFTPAPVKLEATSPAAAAGGPGVVALVATLALIVQQRR